MSGQLHTPAILPPGMTLKYSLNGRVDSPQNRSGNLRKLKEILPQSEKETWFFRYPVRSLVDLGS
jgi:hypothetical protein